MYRAHDKKAFALDKMKTLANEKDQGGGTFGIDELADEVLDLNEDIRSQKQKVDHNRSLIKLNLFKIEGIPPHKLNMNDINTSFYDGSLDLRATEIHDSDSDEPISQF
jgi:hypothetical protein